MPKYVATADDFDNLADSFTDRFHVLGLTRRGQGKSGKPESGYDTSTLVEDIKQFLLVLAAVGCCHDLNKV